MMIRILLAGHFYTVAVCRRLKTVCDDRSPEIEASPPLELAPLQHQLTAWQQRVRALLEVLLCSSLPTQFLIAGILGALGMAPQTGGQLSLTFVLVLSLADTVALIVLMVALERAHDESPWLLWRGRRPLTGELALGFLLVPAAILMVGVLIGLLTRSRSSD